MSGAILIYHSVARSARDAWGITVSPERFAEHMEIVASQHPVLSLRELARACEGGTAPPPRSLAVSFDDGYANNLVEALPILARWSVPVTVFVTTGAVAGGEEFWWDRLERAVFDAALEPDRPPLRLTLGDDSITCAQPAPADRLQAAWTWLHRRPPGEIALGLEQIEAWSGLEPPSPRESHRPLSVAELRTLSEHPLVEIGAHTRTHPVLAAHAPDEQRRQIEGSCDDLTDWLGRPPQMFAYPFGRPGQDYDRTAVDLVREAGLDTAFSTRPALVTASSRRLELPRYFVTDRPPDDFERWLHERFDPPSRWRPRRIAAKLLTLGRGLSPRAV